MPNASVEILQTPPLAPIECGSNLAQILFNLLHFTALAPFAFSARCCPVRQLGINGKQ